MMFHHESESDGKPLLPKRYRLLVFDIQLWKKKLSQKFIQISKNFLLNLYFRGV